MTRPRSVHCPSSGSPCPSSVLATFGTGSPLSDPDGCWSACLLPGGVGCTFVCCWRHVSDDQWRHVRTAGFWTVLGRCQDMQQCPCEGPAHLCGVEHNEACRWDMGVVSAGCNTKRNWKENSGNSLVDKWPCSSYSCWICLSRGFSGVCYLLSFTNLCDVSFLWFGMSSVNLTSFCSVASF